MTDLGARPTRNPEVMWKRLGTEIVTLNRKTHQYHVLNAAAAMIFELATGEESLEIIASRLTETFGIDIGQALEDTRETVAGMGKLGLLVAPGVPLAKYERPDITEITEKHFNEAVAGGAAIACRSLLG